MNHKHALLGVILSAAPLLALAQNTNTPGGQASTGTPIDQTKTSSQKPAVNKSSGTGMDATSNGTTGTSSTTGATSTTGASDATGTSGGMAKKKSMTKGKGDMPAGDVPTYPAPTPDGKPTK